MLRLSSLIYYCVGIIATMLLVACSEPKRYNIGVSQCQNDKWHEKMNIEMSHEAAFLGHINLHIRSAQSSSRQQCMDIDSFISEGVDLLIVSPNEVDGVTAAVERAKKANIPVIIVDRKIDRDLGDVFIGMDNYKTGFMAGQYAAAELEGKGLVVEITGLSKSSPAINRHKGFAEALADHPDIIYNTIIDGAWSGEVAARRLDSLMAQGLRPDLVFAHNDRMAGDAAEVAGKYGAKTLFIGIDALPGKGFGVDKVKNGRLKATIINPTAGDRIIRVADSLLSGQKVNKITLLESTLIDQSNVQLLEDQQSQIAQEENKMAQLGEKINAFDKRYNSQRIYLIVCILAFVLLGVMFMFFLKAYRAGLRNNARLVLQARRLEQQRNQLALLTKDTDDTDDAFSVQLREVMEEGLGDPDFGVKEMAAKMNMARSQLFRKIKAAYGYTPADFLRAARLKRGAEMLSHTKMTVAEVAFAVGFSSPAYFSKCYRAYFGQNPRSVSKEENKAGSEE